MSKLPIHCILAVDSTNGIALDDTILWNCKSYIEYFKKNTINTSDKIKINAVIMERKTWESIPEKHRPLINRLNIVITSSKLELDGSMIFKNPHDAINYLNTNKANEIESIFIIGGKQLYDEFINSNYTKLLYLTRLDDDYNTNIKTHIDLTKYKLISSFPTLKTMRQFLCGKPHINNPCILFQKSP